MDTHVDRIDRKIVDLVDRLAGPNHKWVEAGTIAFIVQLDIKEVRRRIWKLYELGVLHRHLNPYTHQDPYVRLADRSLLDYRLEEEKVHE